MGYVLNMISFIQGSFKKAKIPSPSLSGKFNLLGEESESISLSFSQAAPTVSFHKVQQSSCALTTCSKRYIRVTSLQSPWQAVVALIHKTKWFTLFRLLTLISSLLQELRTVLWHNLGQNSLTVSDSSLPSPTSSVVQCCVFKRKTRPSAFVGNNVEFGEGGSFTQSRWFENSFVA